MSLDPRGPFDRVHRPQRPDPNNIPASRLDRRPLHHAMAAFDLVAFGHAQPGLHTHLHASLYRLVQDACQAASIDWTRCHHEDRGDGLLLIPPPDVSVHLLVDPFSANLHAGVRRHNALSSGPAQLRLRSAIHAGYLLDVDYGIDGLDLIHLFRMLEAPVFKSIIDLQRAEYALIISDYLHAEINQHPCGLTDPTCYQPLAIDTKETHALCWAWIPPPAATSNPPAAKGEHDIRNLVAGLLDAGRTPQEISQALAFIGPHSARTRPGLAELLTHPDKPRRARRFLAGGGWR